MAVAAWIVSDALWERIEPLLPKAFPCTRLLPHLLQEASAVLLNR
jgi:hypothetical protein